MDYSDFINVFDHLSYANYLWIFLLPCCLMGLDFLTGFVNAWAKRKVKSYIMRAGLAKKLGEVVAITIGELFVVAFGLPTYIVGAISLYIICMELVSICENLDKLGVPIPKPILQALASANEKIQNGSTTSETEKEDKVKKNDK